MKATIEMRSPQYAENGEKQCFCGFPSIVIDVLLPLRGLLKKPRGLMIKNKNDKHMFQFKEVPLKTFRKRRNCV